MAVPAADDDSDDEWVFIVAVAVVAVVFALDRLRSGEAEWLAASLPTMVAWATTRSFSLLLVTIVILFSYWTLFEPLDESQSSHKSDSRLQSGSFRLSFVVDFQMLNNVELLRSCKFWKISFSFVSLSLSRSLELT